MSELFITIAKNTSFTMVIKKSRFICSLGRIENETDAQSFIERIQTANRKATHNCFAYMIGESDQVQRESDNGEPSGTAGIPILESLQLAKLHNVVAVVTRYFGGILLGAGGLTRAYGGTAKLALNAAGVSRMRLWATMAVPCTYPLYERMKLLVEGCGGSIEDTEYGADILLTVNLPAQRQAELARQVADLSAGTLEPLLVEEGFRPGPREDAK